MADSLFRLTEAGRKHWSGMSVETPAQMEAYRIERDKQVQEMRRNPTLYWTEGLIMDELSHRGTGSLDSIESAVLGNHYLEKNERWYDITVDKGTIRNALRRLFEAGYIERL